MRFRYLLGRTKLNRILLAWKVSIRTKKVCRLQFTIASHGHYRRVLRETLSELRMATILQREFRERVFLVVAGAEARVKERALKCL